MDQLVNHRQHVTGIKIPEISWSSCPYMYYIYTYWKLCMQQIWSCRFVAPISMLRTESQLIHDNVLCYYLLSLCILRRTCCVCLWLTWYPSSYKLAQFNNSSSKIPLRPVVPACLGCHQCTHSIGYILFVFFSHSCFMGPVGRQQ